MNIYTAYSIRWIATHTSRLKIHYGTLRSEVERGDEEAAGGTQALRTLLPPFICGAVGSVTSPFESSSIAAFTRDDECQAFVPVIGYLPARDDCGGVAAWGDDAYNGGYDGWRGGGETSGTHASSGNTHSLNLNLSLNSNGTQHSSGGGNFTTSDSVNYGYSRYGIVSTSSSYAEVIIRQLSTCMPVSAKDRQTMAMLEYVTLFRDSAYLPSETVIFGKSWANEGHTLVGKELLSGVGRPQRATILRRTGDARLQFCQWSHPHSASLNAPQSSSSQCSSENTTTTHSDEVSDSVTRNPCLKRLIRQSKAIIFPIEFTPDEHVLQHCLKALLSAYVTPHYRYPVLILLRLSGAECRDSVTVERAVRKASDTVRVILRDTDSQRYRPLLW